MRKDFDILNTTCSCMARAAFQQSELRKIYFKDKEIIAYSKA